MSRRASRFRLSLCPADPDTLKSSEWEYHSPFLAGRFLGLGLSATPLSGGGATLPSAEGTFRSAFPVGREDRSPFTPPSPACSTFGSPVPSPDRMPFPSAAVRA